MKTKIIYISGDEVFDIADIRAAFEEVRNTLKLDKNTVLFGVPVDADDAGLAQQKTDKDIVDDVVENTDTVIADDDIIPAVDITVPTEPVISAENTVDSVVTEKPVKKRGRSRKVIDDIEPITDEQPVERVDEDDTEKPDEKIVPILSVLSGNDDDAVPQIPDQQIEPIEISQPEVIPDPVSKIISTSVSETVNVSVDAHSENLNPEEIEQISEKIEIDGTGSDIEPDLEQLLSAMKPLQEDIADANRASGPVDISDSDDNAENIDATLEQLATEFVQTQDKIASESKSGARSKIGKLRNILPFKQSKHKDQGLGDLFGWAGVAANDEDFSVPGFFTNASSRK